MEKYERILRFYLICDILLLTDVFEKLGKMCFNFMDQIFVTTGPSDPCLDAILKMTGLILNQFQFLISISLMREE